MTDPVYDPFDFAVQEDPHPVYAWMREHAPLYRNDERDFWALSRYADVSAALRDPYRYSSSNGISLEPELWGPDAKKTNFFLAMDPPEHGAYRSLVSSAFTPRRVAAMEPRIRELTRARLAAVRERDTFDFAHDYAAALPNDVLCELLGIPAADWDRVRADVDGLVLRDDGSDGRGQVALAAMLRLAAFLLDLVGTLRRRPGEDLTSGLIRAEIDGQRLTDRQIVGFLFIMLGGGNESTGKTIGNAWHRGHLERDVQRAGLNGRAADWASEALRHESASQMVARILTETTVLHGTRVPAGARIALLPASANRDERVFADPHRFDLDRDTGRLISFGLGPHHCLGAALARLEMRVVLEEVGALVAEYDVDLDNSRRCHSPHQHGFLSLPTTVRWRD
ncbi:cytochrome P450 [Micromonospora sp. KLBMP9576]|uniref:cytochrome P450 n=1 Tax=Micromonospora sp. KLBMP9576 TaxID=3424769 RepID=UPI003D940446